MRTILRLSALALLATFAAQAAHAATPAPGTPLIRSLSDLASRVAPPAAVLRDPRPLVNAWVTPTDTFPLLGNRFTTLAGNCSPGGWTGEDRTPLVFGHVSDRFVANLDLFTGDHAITSPPEMAFPVAIADLPLVHPGAIAVNDSGDVDFAEDGVSIMLANVLRVRPGDPDVRVRADAPGSAHYVSALLFEPVTRRLYAVASGGSQVYYFTPGSSTGVLAAGNDTGSLADTNAANARLGHASQLASDADGNLYWAESDQHRVRMLRRNDQRVVTVAGTGVSGSSGDGGPAILAQLNTPTGVAVDAASGRLYVVDEALSTVRVVDLGAGTIASLPAPPNHTVNGLYLQQAAWSGGALYVNDFEYVSRFDGAAWHVVAGGGDFFGPAVTRSLGTQHVLMEIAGLTADGAGGVLFCANHLVLRLDGAGVLTSVAGVPHSVRMGQRAYWFGADEQSAPAEVAGWVQPQGYGNGWSQRLVSPPITVGGHPGTQLSFDMYLELKPGTPDNEDVDIGLQNFILVQRQQPDGSWADVSLSILRRETGRHTFQGGATVGSGVFKVDATIGGPAVPGGPGDVTRLRFVVQTAPSGSNEDGRPAGLRGAGAAIIDNVRIADGATELIPVADFEDGTTAGWTASAMNGPIRIAAPVVRDLPPLATDVSLRSGFDFADPSCAWTFTSPGDTVATGVQARLTSPWLARVPGQDAFHLQLAGKLSTLEEARFVTMYVRSKNAGDTHARANVLGIFALNGGPGPADNASPFIPAATYRYPEDFTGTAPGDSIQIVLQVEDWGETVVGTLDGRPRTRLPYLDDLFVYQLGVDHDFDGVADAWDACPGDCAAGQDANGDGCIDAGATLKHVESWAASGLPVHFRLSQDGDPAITDGSDLAAVRAAFAAWQAVDGDSLPVVEDPLTAQKNASAFDGVNLVTFQDDELFDPDVIAVTPTLSFTKRTTWNDQIVLPGQIVDADMIFNPSASFSTPTHAGGFDLRSVATHEAGHFFGLSHSGVQDATMFFVLQPADGAASLEPDDEAAIASAYPAGRLFTDYGAIHGVVRRGSNRSPVAGAFVTAVPLDAQGAPARGPVASDYTAEDGTYALRRLAAGDYGVYVSPLDGRDGSLTPNYISERVNKIAQTNFGAEWWSTPESDRDDPSLRGILTIAAGERLDSINVVTNVDTLPPYVESVSPPADSVGIRIDASLVVRFSEPVADTTLRHAFFVESGPDTVPGSAALAAGLKTLIFTPNAPLRFGTTYRMHVVSTVTDRQGVPLAADFVSSFTTQEQPDLAILDIQPRATPPQGVVTITGAGFGSLADVTVQFTQVPPFFPVNAVSATPTQLVVRVPANAASGDVVVSQNGHTSNAIGFTVLPLSPAPPPAALGDPVPLPFAPVDVAVSPNGRMAFAVGEGGITSVGLDPGDATNYRVARTRALGNARAIALMPDGRRGYVTLPDLGALVEVITDPGSALLRTPVDTLPLFGTPEGISISPGGRRAYVTDPAGGVIHEIDTDPVSSSRNTVLRELPLGGAVAGGGVAVGPLGDRVFFTTPNAGCQDVRLADGQLSTLHGTSAGNGATVKPDETLLLFTAPDLGQLLWTDITSTSPVAGALALGGIPRDVEFARDGRTAFVVNSGTNQLEMIDALAPLTIHKVAGVNTGSTPVAVAVSHDANVVAVANFGSHSISVYGLHASGLVLRSTYQSVTMPGDAVGVIADSVGTGVQADLGRGTFPVTLAAATGGFSGVAFTTPASEQRDASLALQWGTERTLAVPLQILDHIPAPQPRATGVQAPLAGGVPVCHPGPVFVMKESPAGGLLAATWGSSTIGCDETVLSLVDVAGLGSSRLGSVLREAAVAGSGVVGRDLAFTADGSQLWVLRELDAMVFDAARNSPTFGQTIAPVGDITTEPITCLAADPLGRYMLVGTGHGDVAFYTYRAGFAKATTVTLLTTTPPDVHSLAVSPDGRYAIAGSIGTAVVLDMSLPTISTTLANPPEHAGAGYVQGLAVTSDGKRAVGVYQNGAISVWNLDRTAGPAGLELYYGVPAGLLAPAAERLVPAPDGHGVLAFHPGTPGAVTHLDVSGAIPVAVRYGLPAAADAAISPDGRRLWTAPPWTPDGITLLDLHTLSPATGLSVVSGDQQSGAAGATLPQPVRVHVTDAAGRPQAGVVVRFDVAGDGSMGSLDPGAFTGARSVSRLTNATGEAEVSWQLPLASGAFTMQVSAPGTGASDLAVGATTSVDDALVDPVVLELGPADGSLNLNAVTGVFARFNQAMDATVAPQFVTLTADAQPVAGRVSLTDGGRTVLFQPASALPFGAACVFSVLPQFPDAQGNLLAQGAVTRFTVQTPPALAVTTIDPPAASPGATVTLIGTGFDPVGTLNTVSFNGALAGVVTASETQLSVVLPRTATTGNVVVQVGNLASDPVAFTVLPENPVPGEILTTAGTTGGVRDIAITPDGSRAYVTNPGTNSVTVLDIQAAKAIAAIAVGLRPSGVDILPTGKRAYATNNGTNNVSVIDTDPGSATYNKVVKTIPVGKAPVGIVARGQKVYVLNTGSATLDVIDANPGNATYDRIIQSSNTGSGGGGGVDVSGDGGLAYASTSGGISVIDLTTNPPSLRDTIAIPSGVSSIAIRPSGSTAIALALDGTLYVIDILPGSASENRIIASANTGSGGGGTVDVSGDGTLAYVTSPDGNVVLVFQIMDGVSAVHVALRPASLVPGPGVTLTALAPTPVPGAPIGVATDPLGRFTLVGSSAIGSVTIIGSPTSLPPVAVGFDFDPNTLNLQSHGRYVTGYLEPAPPLGAADFDLASIRLNGVVPVAVATNGSGADVPRHAVGDHDGDGIPDLMVQFSRQAVELILPAGDAVPVTVTGMIGNRLFVGHDAVRVKRPRMLTPAPHAFVQPGRPCDLTWETPKDVKAQWVAVIHSLDGGVSWWTDALQVPNTGHYTWAVPDTTSDSARVAVVLVESQDAGTGDLTGVLATSEPFFLYAPTTVEPAPAVLSFARVQPNPAPGRARMRYGLPARSPVELDVYDVLGRHVRTLARGERPAGWWSVEWHGETDAGSRVGPGVYFARFRAQGREFQQRFTLLR